MGPKKALTAEEGDNIKKEISVVKRQQENIMDLVEEVKALQVQNAEKERRLLHLENRVAGAVHQDQ